MEKKNKSNYSLVILKRKKKLKQHFNCLDIVIVKKSGHNKFFVIEKIGSMDCKNFKIFINFFRLTYWFQYNISISSKCWYFMEKFIINNKLIAQHEKVKKEV